MTELITIYTSGTKFVPTLEIIRRIPYFYNMIEDTNDLNREINTFRLAKVFEEVLATLENLLFSLTILDIL